MQAIYVEVEDLMKTVANLTKNNNGVFKSFAQANFLQSALAHDAYSSFEPKHANIEIDPEDGTKTACLSKVLQFADYGNRSIRFHTILVEYDRTGIIRVYRIRHKHSSDGRSSCINPSRTEIEWERYGNGDIEHLVVQAREDADRRYAEAQAAAASTYVGEVKGKVSLQGTVEFTKVVGHGGYHYNPPLMIVINCDGNRVVWFASSYPDVSKGNKVNIRGTVKEHSEFRGQKQTVLTRCKLEVLTEE